MKTTILIVLFFVCVTFTAQQATAADVRWGVSISPGVIVYDSPQYERRLVVTRDYYGNVIESHYELVPVYMPPPPPPRYYPVVYPWFTIGSSHHHGHHGHHGGHR